MMIETSIVASMIKSLKNIGNLVLTNKERRFREFFEIRYHEMLEIHKNYLKMIEICKNITPIYTREIGNIPSGWAVINGGRISVNDIPNYLDKVRKEWSTLREGGGGERCTLRNIINEILLLTNDEKEQFFLYSVIKYFNHPEQDIITESEVNYQLKVGSAKAEDSPSLTVSELLESETNPEKFIEIFETFKLRFEHAWSNVSLAYAKLYVSHISSLNKLF